ncbi:hypothetical protein GH714_019610 [Hevea brasiliensis]|uniref:WPP domain-containing protein n=1 Tax=Hevea brasiliensis TaxID=3981 RepID=A0A6A6K7G1_HEVBR|nr:hypothetical protein GH714_019610 [Hevea brasiliensis]
MLFHKNRHSRRNCLVRSAQDLHSFEEARPARHMFGAEAGVALGKALYKHAGLTEVYLSYLNLEDEGAVAIANSLKETAPALEVLEMAGNDVTVEAAPTVSACIAVKQNLRKLNLSENELKDEGAIQISKALEEGHLQLNEVDLSTNSIGRVGARVLAQVVVQKPNFKLLNINDNCISDEGIDEDMFTEFWTDCSVQSWNAEQSSGCELQLK